MRADELPNAQAFTSNVLELLPLPARGPRVTNYTFIVSGYTFIIVTRTFTVRLTRVTRDKTRRRLPWPLGLSRHVSSTGKKDDNYVRNIVFSLRLE